MNQRKVMIFNEIRTIFSDSKLVTVFHYNDLSTQDWNNLRLKLDEKNIKIKVLPTKVTRKALEDTRYKNLNPLLHGSTAVAFSDKPCIHDILNAVKSERKLYLLGGLIEDELMTPKSIEKYAELPEKSLVYANLAMTLMAPHVMLNKLLGDSIGRLSQLLEQLSDKQNTSEK